MAGRVAGLLPQLRAAIGIAGSLLLCLWLVTVIDWGRFLAAATRLSPPAILLAALLVAVHQLAAGLRWHCLIRSWSRGCLRAHVATFLVSNFFSLFTPGGLGSDAYRVYAVGRAGVDRWLLAGVVLRERLVGLLGFLALFAIGSLWWTRGRAAGEAADFVAWAGAAMRLSLFATALGTAAVLLSPLLRSHLPRLLGPRLPRLGTLAEHAAFPSLGELLSVLALTALMLASWWLAALLLGRDLELAVGPGYLAALLALTEISRFLPISVQGVGVREAVFMTGVELAGASGEKGVLLVVVLYVLNMFMQLALWGVGMAMREQPR